MVRNWFFISDIQFDFRNTLQLSPEQGPRFCQVNLGLTNVPIGEEIKSVLNLISLPAHVRIGKLYIRLFNLFILCF